MRRILLLLFAVACLPATLPAQDAVELDRLAADQRQVAEQVRRLDKLLEVLQERDRADGLESRAELIGGARLRLKSAAETGDLAAALESVATELARMQTGSALEAQAEAISVLQDLLDYLVSSQQRALDRQRMEDLKEWREGLEKLAARQQELIDQAAELEEREQQEGATDDAAREELAREQQELAEDIDAFNQEQAREGMRSENTERAEQAAEDAAESLQPPPSAEQQGGERPMEEAQRSMDEAQEQQQEAQDALEQQQQEIDEELERRENEARRQILLDVKEEAEKLLERHRAIRDEMAEVLEEADGGRLPRAARGQLRRAASGEREIGAEAGVLMLTIDEYGADSFPYFISQLQQDHERLATQVGPPRYRLQEGALQLADDLAAGWTDLIEAIRVEEDRLRRQMEQPQDGGGQQPPGGEEEEEEEESPLVQFTAELQLLKRMQASLTGQLERLRDRLSVYEAAGLEADPLDVAELQLLQERQSDLALKFESILQRALGAEEEGGAEEDA